MNGKYVVDAGCGDMTFTRPLVEQGARVLAIDPDPVQAKLNRSAEPIANLEFVQTGAERIPVERGTIDGVFFSYSLHHLSQEDYPQVFQEVSRVLKPDGFLYVIEPLDCPLNQVMKLFHNEDQQRTAAQQALQELAIPQFRSAQIVTYHNMARFDSWEAFVQHFSSRSFNTLYTEADVRQREVQQTFERLGGPEHRFITPKQVTFLEGLKV